RSRRAKQLSFQEDLRILVELLGKHSLYKEQPKERPVLLLAPQTGKNKAPTSAIVDVQVEGYPIIEEDKRLDTGTVFDDTSNPLEHDNFEDVHIDEGDE
ncbi:hypothetical protein CVT26_003933, partial [Gymnopilus dilepis]